MDRKTAITQYIDSKADEFLQDLEKLVSKRSVTMEAKPGMPYGEGCDAALKAGLEICESYGFPTRNYDGYVGTAIMGESELGLDILGHLDVVGEGEGWNYEPYTVTNVDGVLYGRGVSDDKGPVLAALYGMRAVRDLGLPLERSVRLIMGTDEESGSSDLDYFFKIEKSAPNTFTPDGDFPVYNTEKGNYRPTMTRSWEPETAEPRVTFIEGGFRSNVLPAKAVAKLAGFEDAKLRELLAAKAAELGVDVSVKDGVLTVMGTASHAAHPEGGNNGNTALLALLASLPLAECESTKAIRSLAKLFPHGDNYGTTLGIDQQDEISGRITVVLSLVNMEGCSISAFFDSRVPLCANDENCRFIVEKALAAEGFDCEGEMGAGHHTPGDTPFVKALLKSYEEFTGLEGACFSMGGGTYVHDIEGGVAFGAVLPGVNTNMHGVDENIKLQDLLTAAKIFAYAISDICK